MMDQLRLNEGDPIRIVGGRYPKGRMIKIQPQSVDFLEVSDPKALCVILSVRKNAPHRVWAGFANSSVRSGSKE